MEEVESGTRGSSYAALKKLGVRPGEDSSCSTFNLPDHIDNNYSNQRSAEIIADHFASISLQYEPIDVNKFPPFVVAGLQKTYHDVSSLTELEVYNKIKAAKKPNSTVPGDMPK